MNNTGKVDKFRAKTVTQKAQKLKRLKELLEAKKAKDRVGNQPPTKVKNKKRNQMATTTTAQSKMSTLQQNMQQKLKGARFRWINESLYTKTGDKAFDMVQKDPSIFEEYHQGFSAQVEKWPVNPVDVYIDFLQNKPKMTVADLGCGEAKLAATVGDKHTVHSFDLVAHNRYVTPCNIAHVPLEDETVDVAIFCLALMGTDFIKFIREANRILKSRGELKIAEVVSRIPDIDAFISALKKQGFKLAYKDTNNKMFIMIDLVKTGRSPAKYSEQSNLLKSCIYKRR